MEEGEAPTEGDACQGHLLLGFLHLGLGPSFSNLRLNVSSSALVPPWQYRTPGLVMSHGAKGTQPLFLTLGFLNLTF